MLLFKLLPKFFRIFPIFRSGYAILATVTMIGFEHLECLVILTPLHMEIVQGTVDEFGGRRADIEQCIYLSSNGTDRAQAGDDMLARRKYPLRIIVAGSYKECFHHWMICIRRINAHSSSHMFKNLLDGIVTQVALWRLTSPPAKLVFDQQCCILPDILISDLA